MLVRLFVFSCILHSSSSLAIGLPFQVDIWGRVHELANWIYDSSTYAQNLIQTQITGTQEVIQTTLRDSRAYVDSIQDRVDVQRQQVFKTLETAKDRFDEYNNEVYQGYRSVIRQGEDVVVKVSDLYQNLNFDSENFRFHVILEQVSLPTIENICGLTGLICSDCNRFHKYLICTVCCDPDEFYEPITLVEAIRQETGSSIASQSNKIFLSGLEWVGLHSVYQTRSSRKQAEHDDVLSLINNFNWVHNKKIVKIGSTLNDEDICGHYIKEKGEGRIVGGSEVKSTGSYPWQLSLATGFFGFFYQHRCGASLISPRWVLTAAHCMKTLARESTYVMAGFLAVNNRDTAQIRRIGNIFVHENFVPNLYEQDIAMLWVDEPFTYSSLVLPVCLPPPSTLTGLVEYKNSSATLTGWGRKWDNGPLSDQLLKVDLPVISNDECMSWYDNSGSKQLIPESTFLCAGYKNGTMDACSGDSGGPLVQFREDQRAQVIGVVSWGIGCGVKGRPGVYTRVAKFVEWIRQTIEKNKDDYPSRK